MNSCVPVTDPRPGRRHLTIHGPGPQGLFQATQDRRQRPYTLVHRPLRPLRPLKLLQPFQTATPGPTGATGAAGATGATGAAGAVGCRVMPCHAGSCRVMPGHAGSCRVMPCRAVAVAPPTPRGALQTNLPPQGSNPRASGNQRERFLCFFSGRRETCRTSLVVAVATCRARVSNTIWLFSTTAAAMSI